MRRAASFPFGCLRARLLQLPFHLRVAPRQLLRALPVEIDPVAQRSQLALHALYFRARITGLAVNLIQAAAFLRELVFARLDFFVRAAFCVHETRHFRMAAL